MSKPFDPPKQYETRPESGPGLAMRRINAAYMRQGRKRKRTANGELQEIGATEAAALVDAMRASRPLRPPARDFGPRNERPGEREARKLEREEAWRPIKNLSEINQRRARGRLNGTKPRLSK